MELIIFFMLSLSLSLLTKLLILYKNCYYFYTQIKNSLKYSIHLLLYTLNIYIYTSEKSLVCIWSRHYLMPGHSNHVNFIHMIYQMRIKQSNLTFNSEGVIFLLYAKELVLFRYNIQRKEEERQYIPKKYFYINFYG